jgi:hypothetical protein
MRNKEKKEKKAFKDTKLGGFLKDKAPNILNIVGDLMPDNGVLGVVKNLISNDNTIAPAEKVKALELLKVEISLFELEVKDRESARNREIEMAKTGRTDWMMYLTGLTGLAVFAILVYSILYREIPESALLHQLIGMIEGVALGIFAYYFGASKSKG